MQLKSRLGEFLFFFNLIHLGTTENMYLLPFTNVSSMATMHKQNDHTD